MAADVDLEVAAREHELAGGSIMNVIRQVSAGRPSGRPTDPGEPHPLAALGLSPAKYQDPENRKTAVDAAVHSSLRKQT